MWFLILLLVLFVVWMGYCLYWLIKGFSNKKVNPEDIQRFRTTSGGKVFCPKCGCTEIGMSTSYGINMMTSAHSNVCKRCGFSWNPSQKYQ